MQNQLTEIEKPTIEVFNAYDLYMKKFPPTKWYLGNVLHEGASLLSGDPKVGKSFFGLQVAMAVAGTQEQVFGLPVGVHGPVLYLAVDDSSEKRMHNRLRNLLNEADKAGLKDLDVIYKNLPSINEGLCGSLRKALAEKQYVMIVIDTFGAVAGQRSGNANVYREDYKEGIQLQKLAQEFGICILIIHHTNKGESKDPVSRASGSHGLTGAVDSVLMLSRGQTANLGTLQARPRDGEECELCLIRGENGGWSAAPQGVLVACARHDGLTPVQRQTLAALEDGPKFPAELAATLRLSAEASRKRLERMAKDGSINRVPDGRYALLESPPPGAVLGSADLLARSPVGPVM